MSNTIKIALKSHVFRFLSHHCGSTSDVVLPRKSAISSYLFRLVQISPTPPIVNSAEGYPKQITIKLFERHPLHGDLRKGFAFVAAADQVEFNNLIHQMMMMEIYTKLDALREFGMANQRSGRMKNEVISWMAKYGIQDDELSLDTILRGYARMHQKNHTVAGAFLSRNVRLST